MTHTIMIPDEVWDASGGSPMVLRNHLYMALFGDRPQTTGANGSESAQGPRPVETPWGTLFFAARMSPCPLCSGTIYERTPVVQTSWTKRTPDGLRRSGASAVHLECAIRNGLEVRWSVERILRDLKLIIKGIPKRKLVRRHA